MMLIRDKIGVKSALPEVRSATPFLPRAAYRARLVSTNVSYQAEVQETTGRALLAAVGILASFTAIQSVQAATDPYEELRSITAARTGSTSLLESFNSKRGATGKTNRGIRERLAAEAANAPKPSSSSSSSSSSGGGFRFSTPATRAKPSAPAAPKASSGSGFSLFGSSGGPKPQAPKPQAPKAASGSGFSVVGNSTGPKPQATKPQAPKPAPAAAAAATATKAAAAAAPKAAAAAAAAGGSGGGVLGPTIQAAGVLALVGVGANAVTSFATSNKKGGAKSTPAAAAPTTGTRRVQPSQLGTARISANKPAASSGSATRKVAAAAAAASRTQRIVKKAPGAAADATGTVKAFVKQALVNSEQPDEPTDFALAGILGFAAVVGAFFIFGLPQATFVEPTPSSRANDPLVVSAKEAFSAASKSTYKNPLFKSLKELEAKL